MSSTWRNTIYKTSCEFRACDRAARAGQSDRSLVTIHIACSAVGAQSESHSDVCWIAPVRAWVGVNEQPAALPTPRTATGCVQCCTRFFSGSAFICGSG